MRALLVLVLLVFSSATLADTASTNNEAYYEQLLTIFTNVLLRLAFLISLVVLLITGVLFAMKTFDPDALNKRGLKPMSFISFIGGIMLASVFFNPLQSMSLFNDLTGMVNSETQKMCSVVEIDVSHFLWIDEGESCVTNVEKQFKRLSTYNDDTQISSANFGLIFGLIQLLALGFMISACVVLAKHIWGFGQVKTTVSQAVIAMIMSSAVYALPNAVDYIQDLRGASDGIINTARD
jgi:hypothetical protein